MSRHSGLLGIYVDHFPEENGQNLSPLAERVIIYLGSIPFVFPFWVYKDEILVEGYRLGEAKSGDILNHPG